MTSEKIAAAVSTIEKMSFLMVILAPVRFFRARKPDKKS
jgi:hypothetical protein